MKIGKGTIVTMEYRIETDKGELIESSVGKGAPIVFNFGEGKMLPGLESRIEGMEAGVEEEIEIPPEEAFGAKDSGPVREMEKSEFPKDTVFRAGENFTARLPDDSGAVIFEIVENKATSVVVRFHHPHEGKTLRCKVKILSVKAKPPAPPPGKKSKPPPAKSEDSEDKSDDIEEEPED